MLLTFRRLLLELENKLFLMAEQIDRDATYVTIVGNPQNVMARRNKVKLESLKAESGQLAPLWLAVDF